MLKPNNILVVIIESQVIVLGKVEEILGNYQQPFYVIPNDPYLLLRLNKSQIGFPVYSSQQTLETYSDIEILNLIQEQILENSSDSSDLENPQESFDKIFPANHPYKNTIFGNNRN